MSENVIFALQSISVHISKLGKIVFLLAFIRNSGWRTCFWETILSQCRLLRSAPLTSTHMNPQLCFILKSETRKTLFIDAVWTSASLSLSLSLPSVLSCSLSTTPSPASGEAHRALEEIQDLRRGEDEDTSAHRSTTMQALGVPSLLLWLMLGHSCADGGKGRSVKKRKEAGETDEQLNCSRLSCTT